jgi:hypothetical protein
MRADGHTAAKTITSIGIKHKDTLNHGVPSIEDGGAAGGGGRGGDTKLSMVDGSRVPCKYAVCDVSVVLVGGW